MLRVRYTSVVCSDAASDTRTVTLRTSRQRPPSKPPTYASASLSCTANPAGVPIRLNAATAASNTTVVSASPSNPPLPGTEASPWASSAVDADTSHPSIIQMPTTIAVMRPPHSSGVPANATASDWGRLPASAAAPASTTISAASSSSVRTAVGRNPYHRSSELAAIQPHATSATASALADTPGASRSSVYVPAGSAVARTANTVATSSTHAPYAPVRAPNAARIHAYDEPASRMRSPSLR